jgi:hypothetical protein
MRDSKGESMDQMADEYDLSESRPNPYAARYAEGAMAVVLDPDVAEVFPDARAVNDALRALAKIIRDRSPAAA